MIEEGVLDVLATTVNTALEDSRNHVDRRVGVHTNQEYEEAPPVHQDAYPVDDDSLSSNVESEEEKPIAVESYDASENQKCIDSLLYESSELLQQKKELRSLQDGVHLYATFLSVDRIASRVGPFPDGIQFLVGGPGERLGQHDGCAVQRDGHRCGHGKEDQADWRKTGVFIPGRGRSARDEETARGVPAQGN